MTFDHFYHHEIFQVGAVVLLALGLTVFSRNIIEHLVRRAVQADRFENKIEEKKREDTVISLFHTSFSLVVWTLAFITALGFLHVNVAGLATGAGLFGVIFGLGAQSTIKNYLSGIYILTENQFRVGDIVTFSGGGIAPAVISGVVEEITLRITKVRDQDGTLTTIRNGDPAAVVNRTFKYANVVIDITVSYDTDLSLAEKVINDTGKTMLENEQFNTLITTPIAFLRVENYTDAGVVLKVIGKVQPAAQWDVAGEFRRLLKPAFDKHNISFGVPAQLVIDPANLKHHKTRA